MKVTCVSQKSLDYLNNNSRQKKVQTDTNCSNDYDYSFYKYPAAKSNINFAGRIKCDFLLPKQISLITNSLINKFEDIGERELRTQIAHLKKTIPSFTERDFVFNIAEKCEFCNIKDYDKVMKYIHDNNFLLLLTDDISIANSLAYLQTKRNASMKMKIHNAPLKDLPQSIMKLRKKSPAILLTKDTIESLEKMAKDSPEDFFKIVKHVNFIYPHGSINGVNAFSLLFAEEIVKKGVNPKCDKEIIGRFLALCDNSIKTFSPENPFSVKFHDIRNVMPYSFDSLVHRLRYRHRFFEKHDETFMPMARLMREIQGDSGYSFFKQDLPQEKAKLRDALLSHSTLYTPIKLNKALKTIHTKIEALANGSEVVYYLPQSDTPKSFNFILSNYFQINNIPRNSLIKDLSQVQPSQKVVILDDYIGSGESMLRQFSLVKSKNIPEENIILAAIVGTKRGLSAIKKHTNNVVTEKVISQFDIKKSAIFDRTIGSAERSSLVKTAEETIIGGYNGGTDNFSTFYMSPNNNNNLFFANIAPGFVVSSYGIKPAFSTFNETILKADLSKLSLQDLKDVVNIYKKHNATLPECIIRKISQENPSDTEHLIAVLNTYGKVKPEKIPNDIASYLQKGLADIDIEKIDNIFLIDNIMDICKTLGVEPPIKFVAQMINEFQKPKSKISDDVLLHFYLKLIDKLHPIKEVNDKVVNIIKNLTPQQMAKFNILEDVLCIADKDYITLPNNVLKRIHEIVDNIEQNGISIELLNQILKTPQIDSSHLDKGILKKWWSNIPQEIKDKSGCEITSYIDAVSTVEKGENV